ncbi:drug:h+ antiporter [Cristinia sonorae]|uniref:Drug:h+ antiporter n=1 Tax=Cristinia sonorae TaxID=1940300 RepID=A0A8K0XM38_9AGAR|nr:drug:h+ antiporter [Cristinia sonorae]
MSVKAYSEARIQIQPLRSKRPDRSNRSPPTSAEHSSGDATIKPERAKRFSKHYNLCLSPSKRWTEPRTTATDRFTQHVSDINYLAFAASSFGKHSLISSIQVAQSIIIACGKPVIAKVADVTSRATAYLAVCYIVIASAKNIGSVGGGIIPFSSGYTGLQLLTQVIIADITTLKWRALVSALCTAPFIINGFIGANVSTAVLEHVGWRWGYGMFAILVPAALSPLIVTLFWAEKRAKKLGLVQKAPQTGPKKTFLQTAWGYVEQMDLVGLLLMGAAVSLILLPLTLSQTAKDRWHNRWDAKFAKIPVVAPRFLKNRAVIAAAWIGFLDFISFYLTNTYLFSFILVVKPWPLINATYFSSCISVSLTVFGICAGIYMRFAQRFKWLLVAGLVVRLAGVGMMIHSRGADASDAEIVWTQIIQGIGGGIASAAAQVGAQASVPHADVAIITAVVLLWTEIGGGVGSALAGAIWTNTMPKNLEKFLPLVPADQRATLFGSITSVTTFPRGDPVREGVIEARQ